VDFRRARSLSLSQSLSNVECTPESWSSKQLCMKIEGNLAPIVEGGLAMGEEGG